MKNKTCFPENVKVNENKEQYAKCSPLLIILHITDNAIMDSIVFTNQIIRDFIN